MIRRTCLVIVLGAIAPGVGPTPGDSRGSDGPAKVKAAYEKLVEACVATHSPAESNARQELATLGREALPTIRGGAERHESWRVRRACYEILHQNFPKDEATAEILISSGLRDRDAGIRYCCIFWLGDMKAVAAKGPLLAILNDQKGDQYLRYAAAKSLAQLGEATTLPTLRRAVSSDHYMDRYLGNLGLKAITGKDINDFEGYRFEEEAYVLSGKEFATPVDPVVSAERSAKRFSAIAAYFRWMKREKPELYAEFDVTRKMRARRAEQLKKATSGK